jgi:hypothetical protein
MNSITTDHASDPHVVASQNADGQTLSLRQRSAWIWWLQQGKRQECSEGVKVKGLGCIKTLRAEARSVFFSNY